ncbi:hypothetical protein BU23DRAFT_336821 [Bimuria novae-zelandiae CBS 107.79]|uniref:Uncharacterized protein n=1 Tax=Bimuria novae-zelandiae CBS 107.79 TaxID=1447943 RepID=A0A6A5UQ05_9PLEO|nr:hypothetical protein BU23DRAFT_336821 [Bimuria novae-zelandiae CBS 107.79]
MFITDTLQAMLPSTPQLRSLTFEASYNCRDRMLSSQHAIRPWILLEQWNATLHAVKSALQTLVISVEFYNGDCTFFKQPDIKPQFSGRLDLRGFDQLHSLEIPAPLLTSETMSILMNTNYLQYAPPQLRHLTLRTDMTGAQLVYPYGTSSQELKKESRVRDKARMELTCISQLSLSLVEQLPFLQSLAIWQPPDPSLDFFDDELQELHNFCKNKSITAKVLYPMLLRRKSPLYWNLVHEVTLFDASYPESGSVVHIFQGERQGTPLGLASQYHLAEFKKHYIRRNR